MKSYRKRSDSYVRRVLRGGKEAPLIGQYVFKLPDGIPFVKNLEDLSTVNSERKSVPRQPVRAVDPARVDLYDLVAPCSPEQSPGPNFSFFKEYIDFLQRLTDLFFMHVFMQIFMIDLQQA